MNKTHWAWCLIDTVHSQMFIIDSKVGGASSVLNSVKYLVNPWKAVMNECKCPQQQNSHDCGVFMLRFIEEFIHDPINTLNLL